MSVWYLERSVEKNDQNLPFGCIKYWSISCTNKMPYFACDFELKFFWKPKCMQIEHLRYEILLAYMFEWLCEVSGHALNSKCVITPSRLLVDCCILHGWRKWPAAWWYCHCWSIYSSCSPDIWWALDTRGLQKTNCDCQGMLNLLQHALMITKYWFFLAVQQRRDWKFAIMGGAFLMVPRNQQWFVASLPSFVAGLCSLWTFSGV